MIYYLLSLIIVLIDQAVKWMVVKDMELYESIPIIEGWLHITSSRNRGAAFSMLQDQRWFFVLVTSIVAIVLIYLIFKYQKTHKFFAFSLALVLGGAIGNFIDRILSGAVVDFIDVRIINFAIFNIADSAISVGAVLLVIYLIFSKNEEIF